MSTLARSKWCQSSINFWRRVKLVKVLPASQTPGMIDCLFQETFLVMLCFQRLLRRRRGRQRGRVHVHGVVSKHSSEMWYSRVFVADFSYVVQITAVQLDLQWEGIWPDLCGELNLARKIKEYHFKPRMTLGIEDYSERLRTIFTRIRAYKLLLLGRDWHRT